MTFLSLWESMSLDDLEDTSDLSLDAIKNGINIREDFWDDFLLLINNSTALAELLDIPETKISSWRNIIKNKLDKVQDLNSKVDTKSKMIKTGIPQG